MGERCRRLVGGILGSEATARPIGEAIRAATVFRNRLRDCEFISFPFFLGAGVILEAISLARLSGYLAGVDRILACHHFLFKILLF